ncbi:hypothetical protein [Serratia marcescens]|uniref:hypothetical protein n=1 Tax=Serratia marcescens TaxID=615 RepID=UPI00237F46C9|nr:hypothetical protein [Serratia marcescens]
MNNSRQGRHAPTPPPPYTGSGEPTFEWAYSWNAPRKGVGSPFVSAEEQKKRDLIIADLAAAFEHLNSQPGLVKRQINSHFFKLEQSRGIQRAHAYLTLNFVKRAILISDSECQLLAKGVTMKIAGNHYYGNSRGDVFTARAPVRAGALMQRFNRLRQKVTRKSGEHDQLLEKMEKEGNKRREKIAQELGAAGRQAPAIEEIDRLLLGGTVKIGAFYFWAGADGRLYGRQR